MPTLMPVPIRNRAGTLARLAFVVALAIPVAHSNARADADPVSDAPVDVRVERVKPKKEKHPTLQFLKENRDFIRARFDLLREKPVGARGAAAAMDPRFLGYRDMLAAIAADGDSVRSADEAQRSLQMLASVTELGDLEMRLDLLERLLAEQRARLGLLQDDFTGDQRTALMVVVTGDPVDAPVDAIGIRLEDGGTLTIPLSAEQQASLRQGGAVRVFHGFVEPREQVVEVSIHGAAWPSGDTGFVTLAPTRDRLTLLRLDVSTLRAAAGAPSIHASTWLHDAGLHATGG